MSEWLDSTSEAVTGQQVGDNDWDEGEPEILDLVEVVTDTCLGPDDPGVGPWIQEFFD